MKRYNNPTLLSATIVGSNLKHPITPHVIIGTKLGEFVKGDIMDANSVAEYVQKVIGSDDSTSPASVVSRLSSLESQLEEINNSSQSNSEEISRLDDLLQTLTEQAPERFDTLKEIADFLANDENKNVAQIVSTITEHTNTISQIQQSLETKADKTEIQMYVEQKLGNVGKVTNDELELNFINQE